MDKGELRQEMRRRYKASSAEERALWSAALCQRVEAMEIVSKAHVVMAFYPLPDEADIRPLLKRLFDKGKTVVLPVVNDAETMSLRLYHPEATMKAALLGTKEPETESYRDYEQIDVALVPGMAFDKEGHRLGRGKGYYDRFLRQLTGNTKTVAIALPYQIVEHVPTEEHDIRIDYV